jgi:hypothetical protein
VSQTLQAFYGAVGVCGSGRCDRGGEVVGWRWRRYAGGGVQALCSHCIPADMFPPAFQSPNDSGCSSAPRRAYAKVRSHAFPNTSMRIVKICTLTPIAPNCRPLHLRLKEARIECASWSKATLSRTELRVLLNSVTLEFLTCNGFVVPCCLEARCQSGC